MDDDDDDEFNKLEELKADVLVPQKMEPGVIPACVKDLKSYEGIELAGERDVEEVCTTVKSMRK